MGMIWVGYRRDPLTARTWLEDEDRVEELLESDDDETSVDLDKAWHGVHWLLTGAADVTDDVTSDALFGGEPIGEDLGYGPPRLLSPERASAVADALERLDVGTLRQRMDARAMTDAEIYPTIWDESDVFDEYLAPAFERLRSFYLAAAENHEAVIQTIC